MIRERMENRNFSVFPKHPVSPVMSLSILGNLSLKYTARWSSRKIITVPI